MTKRIFFIAALLLSALTAFASDRDAVLAEDGTLFTIESRPRADFPSLDAAASRVLVLTISRNGSEETAIVPASLAKGSHETPALNYDAESNTLLVFWQHRINGVLSSEVVFSSYQNGEWSRSTALDTQPWDQRENLRIGVTRRTEHIGENGQKTTVPELIVHAVWWHTHGRDEYARYAMLTIDKGAVASISLHNLSEFVSDKTNYLFDPRFNRDLLRYPMIHESADRDTIDVVFGDYFSNSMHRLRLKPTVKGRLRIPIGVRDAAFEPPLGRLASTNGSVDALFSSSTRLAFYTTTEQEIRYMLFDGRMWSEVRSLPTTEKLSLDSGLQVLRRMVEIE
ncbi:MAG TPA: hypothetical protein VFL80_07055 [Thermoanaerobaculia bacterium]|nr:hypothetical protein [Thermoanaerobaculia bacterium]